MLKILEINKVKTEFQSTNNNHTNYNYNYGEFITHQLYKCYRVYRDGFELKAQN